MNPLFELLQMKSLIAERFVHYNGIGSFKALVVSPDTKGYLNMNHLPQSHFTPQEWYYHIEI